MAEFVQCPTFLDLLPQASTPAPIRGLRRGAKRPRAPKKPSTKSKKADTSEPLMSDLFDDFLADYEGDTDVSAAMQELGLSNIEDCIPGMLTPLLKHQILGVNRMYKQETNPKRVYGRGGILGDEVGLGKTIQTLAVIAKNPVGRTLLILPNRLIRQWEDELEHKTELEYITYDGPLRYRSRRRLEKEDIIVLTTYDVVKQEGRRSFQPEIESPQQGRLRKRSRAKQDKALGPLFQVEWGRIVLDEAATRIRNSQTQTFKRIRELKADIRWCLSANLLYNKLDDIGSCLVFIRAVSWQGYWETVSGLAEKNAKVAAANAHVLLRQVMLRRTKQTTLDGQPILCLPPITMKHNKLELVDGERELYREISGRAAVKVNKWYEEGTVLESWDSVFALLTRQRQLCCHPSLLCANDTKVIDISRTIEVQPKNLIEYNVAEGTGETLSGLLMSPITDLDDYDDTDSDSKSEISVAESEGNMSHSGSKGQHDVDEKSTGSPAADDHERALQVVRRCDPNSKMLAAVEVLKDWQQEDATAKALVFSSFTSVFAILTSFLRENGFRVCEYSGRIPPYRREMNLDSFKETAADSPNVMLISYTCGSVGLNVTAANRVLLYDPAWSPATEEQAIGRVHRIGQQREVRVVRLSIAGTVEDRIREIQQVKKELSVGSMGESEYGRPGRLSKKEVMTRLFGTARETGL